MVGHEAKMNRLVLGAIPDGGPLQRDKLKKIRYTAVREARKGKVPMPPPIAWRFMMLRAAESMPMSVGINPMVAAAAVIVILVRMLFKQMQVGTRVAMMMVEEGRSPGALGPGVEENSPSPSGPDEDRLPMPGSNYPSHRANRLSRALPRGASGECSDFDAGG